LNVFAMTRYFLHSWQRSHHFWNSSSNKKRVDPFNFLASFQGVYRAKLVSLDTNSNLFIVILSICLLSVSYLCKRFVAALDHQAVPHNTDNIICVNSVKGWVLILRHCIHQKFVIIYQTTNQFFLNWCFLSHISCMNSCC